MQADEDSEQQDEFGVKGDSRTDHLSRVLEHDGALPPLGHSVPLIGRVHEIPSRVGGAAAEMR